MKNKQIYSYVKNNIETGISKSSIFSQLVAEGVSDKKVAYFIATYLSREQAHKHRLHIGLVRTLSVIFTLITIPIALGFYLEVSGMIGLITTILVFLIPVSLTYGFFKNNANAYNSFLFLSFFGITKSFDKFTAAPTDTIISIGISILLMFYVYYVKSILFPDFLLSPRKINNEYVFTEKNATKPKRKFW